MNRLFRTLLFACLCAMSNFAVAEGEALLSLDTRFVLSGHTGAVYKVAFVPGAEHLLVSLSYDDRSVRLWNLRERRQIDWIESPSASSRPRDFVLTRDGRQLSVLLAYGAINRYPITAAGFGERERYWGKGIGRHGRLAISPRDTWYAVVTRDQAVTVASVEGREDYQRYAGTEDFRAVSFSADDAVFAAADGTNRLIVWDVLANQGFGARQDYEIASLPGETGTWGLTFSRDGRHLASAHIDGTVTCWRVDRLNAEQTHTWRLAQSAFVPVFSHDGSMLAASSQDGGIYFWQVDTGALLKTYRGEAGSLLGLAIAGDSGPVAAGALGGDIIVWTRKGG